jgi:tRNA(fMet)-specific endonuclease VapC
VILIDTDICVELLRGNQRVVEQRARSFDTAVIAAITVGELFYGAQKSSRPVANRHAVEQFILTVPIIHTTLPILRAFGQWKADLERQGTPLPDADVLIAVTALDCCTQLVTGNTEHFARFSGLRLENWLR